FTGLILGVVGDPGSGRTTELGALAARRAKGAEPAPTLWLRGADLRAGDASLADAVARTLQQAGRIVAPGGKEAATPEQVARLAADAGQPLFVLLDGPEEMEPALARHLADWVVGTAGWLHAQGVRMAVACRPEHWEQWEQAVALCPEGMASGVRIGDLSAAEAAQARRMYAIPDGTLASADAAHPLALRLFAEVREALPGGAEGCPSREEIFTAHLDLMCLRIAVRIVAAGGPELRGSAVRRLAARVSGQVHEAARRCLGPGEGELDREAFEELFPWRTGWAPAVLTEGLLTPAGTGYRFAHEEFADWLQGEHLDVDGALRTLVHRWCEGEGPGDPTVRLPRHRIGPVVQALLLLGRQRGPAELGSRLRELADALDRLGPEPPGARVPQARREADADEPAAGTGAALDDARWWASHLLAEVLLRVPDAESLRGALCRLADRIVQRSVRDEGPQHLGVYALFGPWFWER
ncbi:serine protease, partial [Streptomyces beijiangensis]|nr:serine protease [Streptomyces beijiangensis]